LHDTLDVIDVEATYRCQPSNPRRHPGDQRRVGHRGLLSRLALGNPENQNFWCSGKGCYVFRMMIAMMHTTDAPQVVTAPVRACLASRRIRGAGCFPAHQAIADVAIANAINSAIAISI
jgi:hypothetical protein